MSLSSRFASIFVDRGITRLVRRVRRDSGIVNLNDVIHSYAANKCAEYIFERIPDALIFNNPIEQFPWALEKCSVSGLVLEFGVHEGRSIRRIASQYKGNVFGFDSFEGLREDWTGAAMKKGQFDVKGKLPAVPDNVTLIRGWFQDTLDDFLLSHTEQIRFLHIDCDTYESTKFVLARLCKLLVPGSIIRFDDYFVLPGWQGGEFRAWKEIVAEHGIAYKYISFCHQAVVVEIQ